MAKRIGESDGEATAKRKLVLHFDIRNTMIVADTVTSITVEQALNAYLTGVLWGREDSDMEWVWSSTEPSLTSPEPGTVTYYKHLERIMVKDPWDRTTLRLALGDFVHSDMGRDFQYYYDQHLKLLRWNHEVLDPRITLTGLTGEPYHYVLPSVYQLMQTLHQQRRDFNIIIRTYGLDCENVLESISYCLGSKNHPDFPALVDMPLHPYAGRILRDGDVITLQVMENNRVIKQIEDPDEIYRFMCQTEGIAGFVDDFSHWQKNGYHHTSAKPLWIDPEDKLHHHIFFDDNYRQGTHDSIVDVRQKCAGGWRSLRNEELDIYDNVSLIQVDLLQAIAQNNYYVNKVAECEQLMAKRTPD